MSKFNQKILVAAVAMGLSVTAGAAEIVTKADAPHNYVHAVEVTGASAAADRTASNGDLIAYSISAGDNVMLRAQAVKVTVKAVGGARITGFAAGSIESNQGGVSGEGTSNGALTFEVEPASVFGSGTLFNIAAGGLEFDSVPTTVGGTIGLTVELSDPTTTAAIDSATAASVLTVQKGSTVDFDANDEVPKIDVSSESKRTMFDDGSYVVELGTVTAGALNLGTRAASAYASALGSNSENEGVGGKFGLVPGDKVQLTVTAQNGAAFNKLTNPNPANNNANAGLTVVYGDVACSSGSTKELTSTAPNVFTGEITLDDEYISNGIKVCGEVNGTTAIAAQTFSASAKIVLADTAHARQPAAESGELASLVYNGVSIDVGHVNPASNAAQQSYLRLSNESGSDAVIRISGIDDAGKAGAADVVFTVAKDASFQLNSQDLENGNAAKGIAGGFGSGAGKWRVNVNTELPEGSIKVQNFLRNNTSAGVVNTNVNNEE